MLNNFLHEKHSKNKVIIDDSIAKVVIKVWKTLESFPITTLPIVSISSGQRNLMKTYHNEANTGGITKIALKKNLDSFGQIR